MFDALVNGRIDCGELSAITPPDVNAPAVPKQAKPT